MTTKPNPWYKKFGPFSWYHREWIKLELALGKHHLLSVHWKPALRFISVAIGGAVNKRSMYGSPSSIDPRWYGSYQANPHPLSVKV